jgi:uncharacterized membrane protein
MKKQRRKNNEIKKSKFLIILSTTTFSLDVIFSIMTLIKLILNIWQIITLITKFLISFLIYMYYFLLIQYIDDNQEILLWLNGNYRYL